MRRPWLGRHPTLTHRSPYALVKRRGYKSRGAESLTSGLLDHLLKWYFLHPSSSEPQLPEARWTAGPSPLGMERKHPGIRQRRQQTQEQAARTRGWCSSSTQARAGAWTSPSSGVRGMVTGSGLCDTAGRGCCHNPGTSRACRRSPCRQG